MDNRDAIVAAYIAGATDVHNNRQEDRDPCFKEAAYDYADSLKAKDNSLSPDEAEYRKRLHNVIARLLANDPVCCGRVTGETVTAITALIRPTDLEIGATARSLNPATDERADVPPTGEAGASNLSTLVRSPVTPISDALALIHERIARLPPEHDRTEYAQGCYAVLIELAAKLSPALEQTVEGDGE